MTEDACMHVIKQDKHKGHTRAMVCDLHSSPGFGAYPPNDLPALADDHASLVLWHQQPEANFQAGPSVHGLQRRPACLMLWCWGD